MRGNHSSALGGSIPRSLWAKYFALCTGSEWVVVERMELAFILRCQFVRHCRTKTVFEFVSVLVKVVG